MNKVTELVLDTVKEVGEDQDIGALIEATEETRLFGENLDSMGVVFLVTDLEAAISDEFDVDLTLADERAMSQKTSPFRTVKTLSKYVELLIAEHQED
ncbi:hypothetical protein [Vibrio splendidus]|uniref:hypothetical protein n=1 Tax=Vibrio splendidus TaxID=29497 RepID=UPI00076A5DF6|nr:hypothetical protein [Vibrio splendidus]PHX05752.1 hypothetical protein VSPL_26930 [Vibrio splendidus]